MEKDLFAIIVNTRQVLYSIAFGVATKRSENYIYRKTINNTRIQQVNSVIL